MQNILKTSLSVSILLQQELKSYIYLFITPLRQQETSVSQQHIKQTAYKTNYRVGYKN